MAANPLDINYGTQSQVEYARAMAKFLREKKGFQMTPGMAVLPASWAHGLGDVVDAISQGRYQDIAGQQDRNIRDRGDNPDAAMPSAPSTVGSSLSQYLKSKSKDWFGGKSSSIIPPGTEPKDIVTGSIPEVKMSEIENEANQPKRVGIDRSVFQDEIVTNPNLVKRLASMVKGEVGLGEKVPLDKQLIQLESVFNRSQIRGHGLEQGLLDVNQDPKKGYYASDTYKQGGHQGEKLTDKEMAWFIKNIYEPVLYGSDKGTAFLGSPVTGNASTSWAKDRLARGVYHAGKWWNGDPASEMFVTEKFDADKLDKNPLPMHGRMNLGKGAEEPPASLRAPEGEQITQNYGVQPVQAPAPNAPTQPIPGGYQGVVPPRNPVRTDEQLKYQVRGASSPEDAQRIREQHMKDLEGRKVETPGGGALRIPGDSQGQVTHIPGQDIPFSIGGVSVHLRQKPDGSFSMITPGGEAKDFKSLEDLNKAAAELENQRKNVSAIGEAQNEPITKAIQQGNEVPDAMRTLTSIEAIAKNAKDLSMGPTSPYFNEAKRLFANFFPNNPALSKDIAAADSIEKLNSILASESTKAFTPRGTNFDLQTFMRANPNLMQSREGMFVIVDVLKQEMNQRKDIGELANKYRGKDPATWNARKQEYYDDHPINVRMPKGNGEYDNVTTKKITGPEDLKGLPKGTKFIIPGENTLGTVK